MGSSTGSGPPDQRLDKLLGRYVWVWLWSVAFAANTSATYAFLSFRADVNWGVANYMLAALYGIGVVCVAAAWIQLIRYLQDFLLVEFFPPPASSDEVVTAESGSSTLRPWRTSRRLVRAFRFMLAAVLMRLLLSLAHLLLEAMQAGEVTRFSSGSW